MKRLLFSLFLVAALSGCVAVPYEQTDVVYSPTPVYVVPEYSVPAYVGPPVQLRFEYRSGGRTFHSHRHGFRHHSHGGGIAGMVVAGTEDIDPDNKKPAESDVLAGFWLNVVILCSELVGRRHSHFCLKSLCGKDFMRLVKIVTPKVTPKNSRCG